MPENERYYPPEAFESKENKPEILYRGISLRPEELTVERLRQKLTPGSVNEKDPTKVRDGNELGVYMSTNINVPNTAYSRGGAVSTLETLPYDDDGARSRQVLLPSCGIIYEVNTSKVDIRQPEITPELQGHYNNGFIGEEWIADEVSPDSYQVKKIVLSRYANDSERFDLEITDTSDKGLQEAIDTIQAEFKKRKDRAEQFREFLTTLNDNQRMNRFRIKKWYDEHKI